MRQIVWIDKVAPDVFEIVKELVPEGYRLSMLEEATREHALKAVASAHHLISSGNIRVDGELLDAAPHLRFVQKWGAGFDVLDLDAIRRRGIPCCNTPGMNAIAVAEHTLLLMLAVMRRLPVFDGELRSGRFDKWGRRTVCYEAYGKTLGLVGLGNIGKAVAERARAFGMSVLYHKRRRLTPDEEAALGVEYAPLDELLAASDVVSLHLPLSSATRHLIGEQELRRMKPTSILINTSRGAVVDERALVKALADGWIAGAGLDVFDPEPPAPDNPLWRLENVVVTPHRGGATVDTLRRTARMAFDNIVRVDQGLPLPAHAVLVAPAERTA